MIVRQWTQAERRAAALLGDDWLAPAIEAVAPPSALLSALERAEEGAGPYQLPVAVLGAQSAGPALVVLRLTDFVAWFSPDGTSVICQRDGNRAARG
jgi:hypothetical protein